MMPDIDKIIAFENDEMTTDELVSFFQGMIDSGVVWQLQGFYGRTARDLIAAGLCTPLALQAHEFKKES
jgi:hypothetical protein